MLSGDLPQAVTSSSWWQKSGWVCISQNSPGGFNFDTFNLYMPEEMLTKEMKKADREQEREEYDRMVAPEIEEEVQE